MRIDMDRLREDLEDDSYVAAFGGIPEMLLRHGT